MSNEQSNKTAVPETENQSERKFAADVLQRLNQLAIVVGAVSALVSLVALYVRGNTAIVFWSAGLVAVAVVAIIVIRLADGKRMDVSLLAAIIGIIVVLTAAAVGGIIVYNARPSAHPSAATTPTSAASHRANATSAATSHATSNPTAASTTAPVGPPVRNQGPLAMLGDGATSYDLDSTSSDWGAGTGNWVSQNVQYYPTEGNNGPTLNIANEPVDDVVIGKGTNWTYSDCANAHYDATYHPNPNYVFGANIAPGTAICVHTFNTATKKDGGHYALIEIVSHTATVLTVQIKVWE